jgi:hypothetical protein
MYLNDKFAIITVMQKYIDISIIGGISKGIFFSIKLTIAGIGM